MGEEQENMFEVEQTQEKKEDLSFEQEADIICKDYNREEDIPFEEDIPLVEDMVSLISEESVLVELEEDRVTDMDNLNEAIIRIKESETISTQFKREEVKNVFETEETKEDKEDLNFEHTKNVLSEGDGEEQIDVVASNEEDEKERILLVEDNVSLFNEESVTVELEEERVTEMDNLNEAIITMKESETISTQFIREDGENVFETEETKDNEEEQM